MTKLNRTAFIDFDGRDWRIFVYDKAARGIADDDPQSGITWWPLSWLRFASKEAAENHLSTYGDYASAA
jgi:hypothetical protein